MVDIQFWNHIVCPPSHRFLSFLFHFYWPFYSWDKGILKFNVENRSSMSCVRSKFTVRVWPTSYRLACQSSMPIGPVITGLWLFFLKKLHWKYAVKSIAWSHMTYPTSYRWFGSAVSQYEYTSMWKESTKVLYRNKVLFKTYKQNERKLNIIIQWGIKLYVKQS